MRPQPPQPPPAERVAAQPLAVALPDLDDQAFLEVAHSARADALVTGNRRHFTPAKGRHEIRILTPRALVRALTAPD